MLGEKWILGRWRERKDDPSCSDSFFSSSSFLDSSSPFSRSFSSSGNSSDSFIDSSSPFSDSFSSFRSGSRSFSDTNALSYRLPTDATLLSEVKKGWDKNWIARNR